MWTRKELKRSAKKAFKANYWRCIVAGIIVLFLGGTFSMTSQDTTHIVNEIGITSMSAFTEINELASNTIGKSLNQVERSLNLSDATEGVIANLANSIRSSDSIVWGVLKAVNNFAFKGEILPGVLVSVGVVIYILYWVFIRSIVIVGEKRFYLENRMYKETKFSQLFYIYRTKHIKNVAWIMLKRSIFTILWFFTIVGGFIKLYEYRMIPYILAENPNVTPKEAFRISKEMMKENKWKTFVLDFTFLGWTLLSMFTFNLVNVFFLNPYFRATDTELYMQLRAAHLSIKSADADILDDTLLLDAHNLEVYPEENYKVIGKLRKNISENYMRTYSLLDYVMLFFSFCLIGYIYEVIYAIVTLGEFVNRGTLYGPWLPIYGWGGVATLILFKRFSKNIPLTFTLCAVTCGIIEYTSGWYLETFKHTKYWDYTGYFGNIQGRVCLEGLIVFGLGCCLGIYLLSPSLASLYDKIPKKVKLAITISILVLFLADNAISMIYPNMAAGVPMA